MNTNLKGHFEQISDLMNKAKQVRKQSLAMAISAGKAHLGGAFSCAEILTALYYGDILKITPQTLTNPDRDRFILSKGHSCLALYCILADLGFIERDALQTFGKNGSMLGGHPDHFIPGVEASTGSLGHGLGIGCGLAMSAKSDKKTFITVALLGDGECCEGSVWEAANFAAAQKLNNLIVIIDNNKIGATSTTESYAGSMPMAGKWRAFGWDVLEIDGHNFNEILSAFADVRNRQSDKPLAIIANTVKGKGVSFMENDYHWHHGVPKDDLLNKANIELNSDICL